MHIPVHSPWITGHIEVAQTGPVILTMVGLFPERPLYPISSSRGVQGGSKICSTLRTLEK